MGFDDLDFEFSGGRAHRKHTLIRPCRKQRFPIVRPLLPRLLAWVETEERVFRGTFSFRGNFEREPQRIGKFAVETNDFSIRGQPVRHGRKRRFRTCQRGGEMRPGFVRRRDSSSEPRDDHGLCRFEQDGEWTWRRIGDVSRRAGRCARRRRRTGGRVRGFVAACGEEKRREQCYGGETMGRAHDGAVCQKRGVGGKKITLGKCGSGDVWKRETCNKALLSSTRDPGI